MRDYLIKAVKEGGKVLIDNFGRKSMIKELGKKSGTPHLKIDEEANDVILASLKDSGYDGMLFTEESGGMTMGDSKDLLIIDPLDGTINYANQIPYFAVNLGLIKQGKVVLGITYDPYHDELFYAEKGKGAFLNKGPMYVSPRKKLGHGSFITFDFFLDKEKNRRSVLKLFRKIPSKTVARYPASRALEFAHTACGRHHGVISYDASLWDIIAGAILVKEAGGRVTNFSNRNWTMKDKNIVAGNDEIHKELLKLVR